MMLRGMKGGVVAGRGGGFPVSERRSHWDVVVVVAAAASVALKHSTKNAWHTHTHTNPHSLAPTQSQPTYSNGTQKERGRVRWSKHYKKIFANKNWKK